MITPVDVQLLDVIGWDVVPVPEPSGFALMGTSAFVLFTYHRRRVNSRR